MAPTSLSAEDTQKRFGVSKAIKAFPQNLTEHEEANVKTVLGYMEVRIPRTHYPLATPLTSVNQIAYSPKQNTGKSSVAHFCAKENTFAAPSTFPTAHTGEEYAEAHSHVMASLTDLGIQHFDVVVAKGSYFRSCLIAD